MAAARDDDREVMRAAREEVRHRLGDLSDPVALLEGIFAYAPVGLQVYEASGRCLLVNPAFRELFGSEPPPEYNVLRDEIAERNGVLERIHRAFAGETVSVGPIWYDARELEQITVSEGRRVAIASTFFPLLDRSGKVGHVAIVFKDVTRELEAREQAEQERERFRRESARNQRLYEEAQELHRVKDDFLATVSHELRTPLQAILGWARLLQEPEEEAPRRQRGLETIERNARTLAQLVDDILDASRMVAGRMHVEWRAVDLGAIVRRVVDGFRPTAAVRGVNLTLDMPTTPLVVGGDPDRLQQAAWNVVSNALKFTPAGGRVEVALAEEAGQAVLSVTDSGVGIAAEFLPYLFDRFRQADSSTTRAHGGLGLGLALVRHLVEMHGGTVEAQSRGSGQGAVFTIRLRIHEADPAPPPSVRTDPAPPPRLVGLHVLVVDDEADTRELLAVALGHSGAEVEAAGSAGEALDALRRRRPDVLVCDIGMPGEDGYALLSRVRALSPDEGGLVPAVALTAHARNDDRRQALSAGYQVHLAKPVDPAELVGVVARMAGRQRPSAPA